MDKPASPEYPRRKKVEFLSSGEFYYIFNFIGSKVVLGFEFSIFKNESKKT